MGSILNEQEVIQAEIRALEAGNIENRKHKRRTGRWAFKGVTSAKNTIAGYTENVSEGGVLLIVNESFKELEKNKNIYIEIMFSYKGVVKKIKTVAKIKHVVFSQNNKKVGLQYIKIPDRDRKLLNTYANYKI